ncbi:hypothetical protein HMPREF0345_0461 [Enterococcus faecalis ATCC 29200]|nr:hypothetical protein HMPREF0345_0461 [Enterococcus faecalis ATCC 29200]
MRFLLSSAPCSTPCSSPRAEVVSVMIFSPSHSNDEIRLPAALVVTLLLLIS